MRQIQDIIKIYLCPICDNKVKMIKIIPQQISEWNKEHDQKRDTVLTCCNRILLYSSNEDKWIDYGKINEVAILTIEKTTI